MIAFRFVAHDTLLSKAICAATWSPFSHVDIVLPEGLLGALPDGVQIRPYGYDDGKPGVSQYFGTDIFTASEEEEMYDFWRDQVDKPYDFKAVAGVLFHHDWRDMTKWYCSELAFAGPSSICKPLLNETYLDRVTPGTLLLSPYLRPIDPPRRNRMAEVTYQAQAIQAELAGNRVPLHSRLAQMRTRPLWFEITEGTDAAQ